MCILSHLLASVLTITAGGDAFMVQGFPKGFEIDPKLTSWIASGDARLVNFETVVNDGKSRPAAWSGGTWSSMDPSVLPDFLAFGFNGCGCANNHSLDFGFDSLFLTMKTLRERKMPFAGIGETLQEATKAAFVDTPNGRVAFVSVSADFHPDAMAGWKTSRSPGRPGLNGLRYKETYLVTEEQLGWVKEVASGTGINGNRELNIRTGFDAPDAPGTFQMGKLAFKVADRPGRTSACNANDLKRLTDEIAAAKKAADAVVVLAHSHMMRYKNVEEPAPYFMEFCRAAVDAGADVVIGGGTHQLKGIEIRNGRPIFYSLGDFVFQNNVVPLVPPDFCEKYKVPLDADAKTAFNARSKGGKVGLHAFRENFLSVVPRIRLEGGRVKSIELLPIELHWKKDWSVNGLPRPADDEASSVILAALQRTSAEFGTKVVRRADGVLEVKAGQEPFSPIVPVLLDVEKTGLLVKDLARMHDEFGFSRFILVGPDCRRWFGRADLACYEKIGREIAEIRQALAGRGIRIGWWCDPTFHAHEAEPWQRIMDCDGNVTGSVCPLDEGHAADFARKLCAGLRIGRPDPIFIEDDFTLSNHGGMNAMKGCFCPLHMKAYEKKVGRAYTPKEVAAMFRDRTAENAPLRQAWADMSRESLVWFASYVRREIDKVAPETRVCQCQSGFVDIDGDSTEAVARAWAGKNRPLSRLFGAGYWDENPPMNVAANLAHVFWSAQHLPGDFELVHETDAYPHTRFYNSSLFLLSEFAGALMAGVHDSYYYCLQYTDDPLCDTGYVARMREFRPRLSKARDFRLGAKPVGVRMVYTPKEAYMVRETTRPASCGMLTASTTFLAKLGFPIVTCEDAPVATLFGSTPNVLSDDEIRVLLKGGLFLDGEAAEILTKRGFADLIGVTAADDVETKIQFRTERILSVAGLACRGSDVFYRRVKAKPIIGWTPPHSVFAELKPAKGAVVWSEFVDVDGKAVAPSVTCYENALGGRIGVMALSADVRPPHMSLYTPRKQEMFHNLFSRLAQDRIAVRAPKTPNTFVLAAERDGELLVMVNNLAGEPRDDVRLAFAPDWDASRIERLAADGTWRPLEDGYVFQPLVPEFLRVKGSVR